MGIGKYTKMLILYTTVYETVKLLFYLLNVGFDKISDKWLLLIKCWFKLHYPTGSGYLNANSNILFALIKCWF